MRGKRRGQCEERRGNARTVLKRNAANRAGSTACRPVELGGISPAYAFYRLSASAATERTEGGPSVISPEKLRIRKFLVCSHRPRPGRRLATARQVCEHAALFVMEGVGFRKHRQL